jgi:RNA-binding protein
MAADERMLKERAHGTDATFCVGKSGIESVTDELDSQLRDHELMKGEFRRAARGDATTAELATDLAERAGAELIELCANTVTSH